MSERRSSDVLPLLPQWMLLLLLDANLWHRTQVRSILPRWLWLLRTFSEGRRSEVPSEIFQLLLLRDASLSYHSRVLMTLRRLL